MQLRNGDLLTSYRALLDILSLPSLDRLAVLMKLPLTVIGRTRGG